MSSTKELSLLVIGLIPIPITSDMRIINTDGDAYYNFVYDKYPSDYKSNFVGPTTSSQSALNDKLKSEYYENMRGSVSRSLNFKIPFERNSPTTKALSLLLPLLELVALNRPKSITYQFFNNQAIDSFINKQKTLVSYYDSIGFSTFFNYKLDSVIYTEDKNEDLISLTITATKDSSENTTKIPSITTSI